MKCPIDDATLVMSERSGIEIDFCPQCRGVWLDRGELDKIIDRSISTSIPDVAPRAEASGQYRERGGHHSGDRGEYRGNHDQSGRKRRGGWLGELFD
jgi:Zn-finger nucleic acid-binding protein